MDDNKDLEIEGGKNKTDEDARSIKTQPKAPTFTNALSVDCLQSQTEKLDGCVYLDRDANFWKYFSNETSIRDRAKKHELLETLTPNNLFPFGITGRFHRRKFPDGLPLHEGGRRLQGRFCKPLFRSPVVSIVTVVYNSNETLERCILSVMGQSYENVEYIIIDGGSTDGTLRIVEKYNSYIDYWCSEKDSGVYEAMNKGLALASGEFIAMLNADDFFLPDAVERSIECIMREGADYSIGGCSYIDNIGKIVWQRIPKNPDDLSVYDFSIASHQTYFVARMCYEKIGPYDESYRIASDYNFRNLLINEGFLCVVVPGVIVFSDIDGMSNDSKNRTLCLQEVYRIAAKTTPVKDLKSVAKIVMLVSEKSTKNITKWQLFEISHEYMLDHSHLDSLINLLMNSQKIPPIPGGIIPKLKWLKRLLLKSRNLMVDLRTLTKMIGRVLWKVIGRIKKILMRPLRSDTSRN
jgi:glycosyltransferase involved in cell wall biosynthesis